MWGHAYLWEEELIDASHSEYTMRAQLRLQKMIYLVDNLCILENTGGRSANLTMSLFSTQVVGHP